MSAIGLIKITKDTSLYSSNSSTSEIKCELPEDIIAHIDMSPPVMGNNSKEKNSFFFITVTEGVYENEKGWIKDNTNHYQYL